MRLSRLFGRTLREMPAGAEMVSHQLLLRAGFIRPLAPGIFSYLPLGWRTLRRIERVLREEMDRLGGQEVHLPLASPAGPEQRTRLREGVGPEPARFCDRTNCLPVAMMAASLVRQEVQSYRDLPCMIYQIRARFRDGPRPRGGLINALEFIVKDALSCHADLADLDAFYQQMYAAYERIFTRCGLEVLVAEADIGKAGDIASHEFIVLNDRGEDTLILCPACGYAANREWAAFGKGQAMGGPLAEVKEVATPGCKTIAQVAQYLGVSTERTLKAVFYTSDRTGRVIFVVIRGDLEVNETKLSRVLAGEAMHPATEEELKAAGIVAGYASPVGLSGPYVVADDSINIGVNFVAGANREGYHLIGVNYPRDFDVDVLADIALAKDGRPCLRCGRPLKERRGIEVGHLYRLGPRYSERVGVTFLDRQGRKQPVIIGSYSIGLGRLMAAIVEQHHDEKGIIWPPSVAPYQIHLLSLGRDNAVGNWTEKLYEELRAAGYEVLYDDRPESAGVKFNDADLIGLPLRLTLGRRTLAQGAVEWKLRRSEKRELVPLENLKERLEEFWGPKERPAAVSPRR